MDFSAASLIPGSGKMIAHEQVLAARILLFSKILAGLYAGPSRFRRVVVALSKCRVGLQSLSFCFMIALHAYQQAMRIFLSSYNAIIIHGGFHVGEVFDVVLFRFC